MVQIYEVLKHTRTKPTIKESIGIAPGYFSYIICIYVFHKKIFNMYQQKKCFFNYILYYKFR